VADTFTIGQRVRYKPGHGTYGYEDVVDADGRVPGEVIGHSRTRVRVVLTLGSRRGQQVTRAVDAASLIVDEGGDGHAHADR
jgi:hypothetical protein